MENQITPNAGAIPWERQAIEKLLLADLRERRAARRWRIVKSVIWMLLLAALIWALILDAHIDPASGARRHTAVVAIHGEIADRGEVNAQSVLPAMREALQDSGTQALVLLINSPGGSPVQAGLIYDEIGRLRKKYGKPIYAVVEDSCASGAYYIASAADRIYVDKASIVGSIGVLMNSFGFVGTLDKLGIERRLLIAGKNKGFLDPFSPLSPEQRDYAQTLLEQIHHQFINAVKQGRGERLKETPEIFSGLFWTGEQSIQLGLADDYGSLDSVAREVVKAEKIIDYSHKGNLAERLARRFGTAVGEGAVGALRSLPALR